MSELIWGEAGKRYYEAGVDHGVLFVDGFPGVAWTGLTAVQEKATGGEPKPYYIDGVKYINVAAAEEFEANIEAYTAPLEFNYCDGTIEVANGLYLGQQPRRPFNFSYRTLIGNDLEGLEHGYKLHIVYNALAKPSERNNSTIGDSSDPMSLSWDITTTPIFIPGAKPTAHMTIDSRYAPNALLNQLNNMLYGTATTDPQLPTAADIVEFFGNFVNLYLYVPQLDGSLALELVPAFVSPTEPTLKTGQEMLWIDSSAGTHSSPRYVIGD